MDVKIWIDKYYSMIYRVACARMRSADDACDICQEVFLKALEHASHFEGETHFKNWLIRVTINACMKMQQSAWKRNTVYMSDEVVGVLEHQEERFSYMDNYTFDSEIMETVNTLPEKYAGILRLYYFQGYSIKEIMRIRQMNVNTVKSQLSRARGLLRSCLDSKRYVANAMFRSISAQMQAYFKAYREYARAHHLCRKPDGPGCRPAVLGVDLANGWTRPGHPFSCDADQAVSHCAEVFEAAREYGVPCLFSRTIFQKHDSNLRWLDKMPATQPLETDYWNCLDDRLRVRPDEKIFAKNTLSCLKDPLLNSYLQHLHVDTLIIMGVTASGAVRHTVMDAAAAGYRVIVPGQAVADRIEGAVDWNLFDIDLLFGDVLSTGDVIRYLEHVHPLQREPAGEEPFSNEA